jgi:hypothetical protein
MNDGEKPENRARRQAKNGQNYGLTLGAAVALWPTPMADTPSAGMTPDGRKVTTEAGLYNRKGASPTSGDGLATAAMQWPTPAAQNAKGSSPDSTVRADGKSRMDILHYRAEQGFSRPDPQTGTDGTLSFAQRRLALRLFRAATSPAPRSVSRPWCPPMRRDPSNPMRAAWRTAQSRKRWQKRRDAWWAARRLNPTFVGWMMGWPTGHALCACSETEWSRWSQAMRGALSRLPTASGPWVWKPPEKAKKSEQFEMFS